MSTTLNVIDSDGNPLGGSVLGQGMRIDFQHGPIGENGANGAQVEDVLEAALQRLVFLNTAAGGRFACRENSLAITKIEEALHWLEHRTKARQARGVEGTNQP